MEYNNLILTANAVPIIIMLVMALLLCFASRFKGNSSYMALFILFTTLPDFIYITCDLLNWDNTALLLAPIAYSVNLTLMPVMLILAYRTFNPDYSFRYIRLLHFLPAIGYALFVAIYISTIPEEKLQNLSVEQTLMIDSPLPPINLLMLLIQLIVYFYIIFSYLRSVKRYIFSNLSRSELSDLVWIPRFITLIGILVVTAIFSSLSDPLGGLRLFYVINVIAIGYLLYCELKVAFTAKENLPSLSLTETEIKLQPKTDGSEENLEQMRLHAAQIKEYLQSSEAYINPNLSLKDVAKATGISDRNLSKSINIVLGKNFFDLINGYRIEKSKELLLAKKEMGLTLETIAEQCGFNSRFTLNSAFKKSTGLTTTKWIKESNNPK